jgi:hypothetical protein
MEHQDMLNTAEEKMSEAQGYLRCVTEDLQEHHELLVNMDERDQNYNHELIETIYNRIAALDALDTMIYEVMIKVFKTRERMKEEG